MCHDQDRVLKEYIEVQCDIRCQVSVCNFSFLSVHISRYTEYYKRCSSYVETFELVDGGNQALNDVKVRLPAGVPIPELVLLARRELVRRDFLNLIVRHAIEYPRVQLVDVSPPPRAHRHPPVGADVVLDHGRRFFGAAEGGRP